jgi:hypothetical protein
LHSHGAGRALLPPPPSQAGPSGWLAAMRVRHRRLLEAGGRRSRYRRPSVAGGHAAAQTHGRGACSSRCRCGPGAWARGPALKRKHCLVDL